MDPLSGSLVLIQGDIKPMKAVIIGGSVGGLFAANMLLRRGWDVDVFERVQDELASRGAGIAGHTELTELLRYAGARMQARGIDVDSRVAYDQTGAEIARFQHPQYLTAWSFVYRALFDAFPQERFHHGMELVEIERQADGRSVAAFANGTRVLADVIVGADGFRSRVRELCAPEVQPVYAGYVAFRGVMSESLLSEQFRREVVNLWSFVFPGDGQLIGYPLLGIDDSTDPGRRRYSYLWYRNIGDETALRDLLTDDEGHEHRYSIPPPLIRFSHIEALKRHALATLPSPFSEIVIQAEQHMVQPIYDVDSPRMTFGPVALLGDAAFVARPHVGIGVLKAAQDAKALAEALDPCLTGSLKPEKALEQYGQIRVKAGHTAVAFARHLGSFIGRGLRWPWSDPALGQTPQYLVRVSARPMEHLVKDLEKMELA
jgi:2-polyprenyl-6-methoxyphenol hydroxylase-like FAD-dependent oxidoreductase